MVIARRLEVSRVWVYQVRWRELKTGRRRIFPIGGHRRSRIVAKTPHRPSKLGGGRRGRKSAHPDGGLRRGLQELGSSLVAARAG
ncbi:MAG: hypothetical protein WAO35_16655, partial [Terriglobia bacterium]